ncbi:hypothetical protein NQ317_014081 [Molorchus minor]|uniref:Mediator of RNA polymerase II transcription subunit 23 n=1 Tax=Molorchus minor TaxID=1323400 RepID=A0ABQ9JFF7_9CUCU|nr:hypothetical protein NQ317_014081 [Molorchus minor]
MAETLMPLNDILRCIDLIIETEKISAWQQEIKQYPASSSFTAPASDGITQASVRNGSAAPRKVCEVIITSETLQYNNSHFWIECFNLIKRIIDLVEYKGVREIMKGCCEKAKTLPWRLNSGLQPQTQALLNVAEKIMDRNACLLPGYLLVNELQKSLP